MTATAILQAVSDEPQVAAVALAQLLESRGWTAEELARRSGLASKTISRLLNGRTSEPKRATVAALATTFGVDESVFAGERPRVPERQLDRIEAKLDRVLEALVIQVLEADDRPERPREHGTGSASGD